MDRDINNRSALLDAEHCRIERGLKAYDSLVDYIHTTTKIPRNFHCFGNDRIAGRYDIEADVSPVVEAGCFHCLGGCASSIDCHDCKPEG